MEKSFGDIVTESVSVFKKSILPVLGIWGILFGVIILCGILTAIIIGAVAGTQVLNNIQNNIQNPFFIMAYAVPFIIAFVAFFFIHYIFFAWMILVIRNNAIVGKSFFKATFVEAARKIFKVFFLGILMAIVYFAIGAISYFLLHKYFFILMIPLIMIIAPTIFTTFYAILCREGGFWEIISEAISLSFERWFKIMGFAILFIICYMIVIFVITFGVSMAFGAMNLAKIGSIILFLFQIVMMIFPQCFYTIFYLDLAGIKAQEKVEIIETEEKPLEQTLEKPQNPVQQVTQPEKDNQEPPHMDTLN